MTQCSLLLFGYYDITISLAEQVHDRQEAIQVMNVTPLPLLEQPDRHPVQQRNSGSAL